MRSRVLLPSSGYGAESDCEAVHVNVLMDTSGSPPPLVIFILFPKKRKHFVVN